MAEGEDRVLPVSFSAFLVSLASAAMVNLGEVPHPTTNERAVDLVLARHNIDLIALLQEKTRGNLDEEETKLLEGVLYDLRMKYVEKKRTAAG